MPNVKAQFANRRLGAGCCETGSWRWMLAEHDEMEPPRTAVEILGGDAAEAPQEALDLAVAAVDRLDVQGAVHPFAGGGPVAAAGIGDEQGVRGDHRCCAAVSSSKLENQSRNRARSISLSPFQCTSEASLSGLPTDCKLSQCKSPNDATNAE